MPRYNCISFVEVSIAARILQYSNSSAKLWALENLVRLAIDCCLQYGIPTAHVREEQVLFIASLFATNLHLSSNRKNGSKINPPPFSATNGLFGYEPV